MREKGDLEIIHATSDFESKANDFCWCGAYTRVGMHDQIVKRRSTLGLKANYATVSIHTAPLNIDNRKRTMEDAVGLLLVTTAQTVFEEEEKRLLRATQHLQRTGSTMRIDSDAMQALILSKKGGKFDPNADPQIKKVLLAAYRLCPSAFGHLVPNVPEGLMQQPLAITDCSLEGVLDACTEGMFPDSIILPVWDKDDVEAVLRGLQARLDIQGGEVSQTTFKTTQIYGDREQVVKIMHEILDQLHKLLSRVNGNMKG